MLYNVIPKKASSVLRYNAEILKSAGVDNAYSEAETLVLSVIHSDRNSLYRDDPPVSSREEERIHSLIARRLKGEPLSYILGYVDFLDLRLQVGPGVLIPRPETELAAHAAIELIETLVSSRNIKTRENFSIIDLCTGSGCLALSIAQRFPFLNVLAVDISANALSYARENAARNKVENVFFICCDLFGPIRKKNSQNKGIDFNLIVSNPPYIKSEDIKFLQKEIRNWEPDLALDGGDDGMVYYRIIFTKAQDYLKKGGYVIVEIGFDQGGDVSEYAHACGFQDIMIKKDYAHFDRIVSFCYN